MAEATTETTPTPKPDWIASTLSGKLKGPSDLAKSGLKAEDFDFVDDPKAYWAKDKVKEIFENNEGAFRDFYRVQKDRYENTKISDRELDVNMKAVLFKGATKPFTSYSYNTKVPDIYGRTRVGEFYGPKKFTIQGNATDQGVKMGDKYVAPDTFDGVLRLAKDDQGQIKLNENNRPFWEPLKDGEELRSFDETYSEVAEWAGMYGVDRSYARELGYSTFKAIPNFLTKMSDSMLEIYRVPVEMSDNQYAVQSVNKIKEVQTNLRGYILPTSPHAQEGGFFDPVNLYDLGLDVTLQLLSMGGVAKTAAALGANAANASRAGLLYMTGLASGSIAQVSREAGLNPYETAVMYGINAAAIYKIAGLSDMVINGVRPLEFNAVLDKTFKKYGMELAETGMSSSALKSYYNKVSDGLSRAITTIASKPGAASGFFLEGLEETTEQVVDSGTRGLYNILSPLYQGDGHFNWDPGLEFEGLIQAGIGGGIGGSIGGPLMKRLGFQNRQMIDDLESSVAFNDEAFSFRMIDKWEKQNKLGQTQEQNSRNAAMLRNVVETMVDIRDRAGLKNVISNNEKLAGKFANLLRDSSIGRDKVVLGNDLRVLENELLEVQKQTDPDKDQEARIQTQIERKKAEIASLNEGKLVSRYIAEGAYNIHADPELSQNKGLKLDPADGFNGRVFADMNQDAIDSFKARTESITKTTEEITAADNAATFDTYEGISKAGKDRLVAEAKLVRDSLLPEVQSFQEQINSIPVLDSTLEGQTGGVNILWEGKDKDAASLIESALASVPPGVDIKSEPWYNSLVNLIEASKKVNELQDVKNLKTVPTPAESDDFLIYDFEEGRSTVPLQARIEEEIKLLEDSITPGGISTYVSDTPNRLKKVLMHRRSQLEGILRLKYEGPYPDLAAPDIDPAKLEDYNQSLSALMGQINALNEVSESNKNNTEARVLAVYMERLKTQHDYLRHLARKLPETRQDIIDAIDKADVAFQTALDKSDAPAFNNALYSLEKELYEKHHGNAKKILEEVHPGSQRSVDYPLEKGAYDYLRSVLNVPALEMEKARLEYITELIGGDVVPTMEQQDTAMGALRGAISGEYDYDPGVGGHRALSYTSALDGSGGSGKTAVVVPMMASLANKILKGKVIVTASPDATGSKAKRVQNDIERSFGKKPDYIKYSEKSLLDILSSKEIDDVNLIIYDEASLIPGQDLVKINSKLNEINTARRSVNGSNPLHIIYTYDGLQNGWSKRGIDRSAYSINSKSFHKPTPPRMTFSFRQTNEPLNAIENLFKRISMTKGIPTQQYTFQHNSDFDGVTIVKTRDELERAIEVLRTVKSAKEASDSIVYIKANENITPVPTPGIKVMSSIDAQGGEWDYVIAHAESIEIPADKAELYTMVTRPKKGLILLAPDALNIDSIEGPVRPFTTMKPTPLVQSQLIDEISNRIGEDATSKPISFSAPVGTTKMPAKEDINDQGPEEEVQPDPMVTSVEVDENLQKALQGIIKPDGRITGHTFFTNPGELDAKKRMLFDPKYQANTRFYLTVARINSPGYRNSIGAEFEATDKYGVFVEGINGDNRAVIATISSKDITDEAIKKLDIYDPAKDILVTQPISSDFVKNAMFKHPFVVNTQFENGVLKDKSTVHSMQEFESELESKGIITSNILIATQDIKGVKEKGTSTAVGKGYPFVIMNFNDVGYPRSEFRRLVESPNFDIRKSTAGFKESQFRTIQLYKKRAQFRDIVSLMKNGEGRYWTVKDGKFKWTKVGQQTLHSFWYNELSGQTDYFRDIFERVEKTFPRGSTVRAIIDISADTKQNKELKTAKRSTSYRAFLLNDMVEAEIMGKAHTVKAFNSKQQIFNKMMTQPELSEGLLFSPSLQAKGQTAAQYARIHEDVSKEAIDKFLGVNYYRIDPPVVQFNKDDLKGMLESKEDSAIPTESGTNENGASVFGSKTPVTPMKFAQFLEAFKSIPGGDVNAEDAREAIRIFRKGVMDAHVALTVPHGGLPGFQDINKSLKKQRDTWNSEVNRKTTALNKTALMHYAVGSHFNELLAEYFPGIAYDSIADAYSYDNSNFKTSTWTEQESEDLLTTGMNSIVKTYLFNTPVGKGFFTPRHLSKILPIVHGRKFHEGLGTQRAVEINDIENALAESRSPEAQALYHTFFKSEPTRKGTSVSHSYRTIGTEQGHKVADAIGLFLISGDSYVPGFSTLFRKYIQEGEDRVYAGDIRAQKYPTGYFLPSITANRFASVFSNNLKKGEINKSKSNVSFNGNTFPIEDVPTRKEILRKIKATGLPGYTEENLDNWIKLEGEGVLNTFQDYFVGVVKNYTRGVNPDSLLGGPVTSLLDSYSNDHGLGNSMSSMNINNRRQYLLRTTSPIFHTFTVASNIRALSDTSTILKDNLLISSDSGYGIRLGDIPAFVNNGIKITGGRRDRAKAVSKMSMSELLDTYMIDGFIAPVSKGAQNVSLPVAVYADSSSEINPIFSSNKWDRPAGEVLNDLFASRQKYYTKLEKAVVDFYRAYDINAKDINDLSLQLASLPVDMAELMKDPNAIAGVHYDPGMNTPQLKNSLINDINFYKGEQNREAFKKSIDENVKQVIEFSKIDNGATRTTYDIVRKDFAAGDANKANILIEKFYVNWLAMSTEFQKAFNGPEYQYKDYEDNGKRARSLTSPAAPFLYRNKNWEQNVAAYRLANPGQPLPTALVYEGKKLNRISKVYVVEDPMHTIMQPNGTVKTMSFVDGATLVTPFTRIQQDYSTALSYGRFIGPIMKNVTHSVDPVLGIKTFIKNAEFEITPERLRNGDEMLIDMFTRMVNIPFSAPVAGASTALDLLVNVLGVEPDFSNITREHFIKAMDLMAQEGQQDNYIQELVFVSSLKSAQRGVNRLDDPSDWSYTPIDITMKGTQQDAMKDPTKGLDTKVLTQLVNAIAVNWKDDATLRSFYNQLSSVTKEYLDNLAVMPEEERNATFDRLTREGIIKNDEVSARSQAAYHGVVSINDRATSPKYIETVVKDIVDKAVAFQFRGGQYVLSPSFTMIYRAVDKATGKPVRLLKSQFDEAKHTLVGAPQRLRYVDAIREDGLTLAKAYETMSVEEVHSSLEKDNWTQGRAEILLPAEMEHEFMLTDALAANIPIHEITPEYFEQQLNKQDRRPETPERVAQNKNLAGLVYESFQLRTQGIMSRIPTSGKHSAVVTEIVGFMQESMNAVEVPTELYAIQGADQDIDKGSYLTYQSLVKYDFLPSNAKSKRVHRSFNPSYGESFYFNVGGRASGLIPFTDNVDAIIDALGVKKVDDKRYINKVAIQNSIVRDLNTILQNPKNLIEASKSTDEIIQPWKKLKTEGKTSKSYDDLMSLLQLHQDNQAGGTDLVGIFANGAKAYNVIYAAHQYNKRKPGDPLKEMAGLSLDSPNTVWETYSALMNLSVDNAKLGINGVLGINQYTAPYFSYLASQGMLDINPESIAAIKEEHAELFRREAQADHYNRKSALKVKDLPDDSKNLFYKTQEWNLLSRAILNRTIPTDMPSLASYVISMENFVNISYKDSSLEPDFDMERFTKDEDYASSQIEKYEQLAQTHPRHSVNVLFALNGIPHVKQYTRAAVAAHQLARRVKSYDILTRVHRGNIDRKTRQYYFYDTQQFSNDYEFLEGFYIDAYLKTRDFSDVADFDLGSPAGRREFVNNFAGKQLTALKAAYPNNKLIADLQYDAEQNLVRVNDFYDVNDELRSIYMSDMASLEPNDRKALYIYSLITTRGKTSKGSLSPFFSYSDKMGYLNFVDHEMEIEVERVRRRLKKYDPKKDDSSIPYESAGVSQRETEVAELSDRYNDINVFTTSHIVPTTKSPNPIPIAWRDIDGDKAILVNEKVIETMFASKEWMKKKPIDGGTYTRAFREKDFSNVEEYKKYMIYSMTSALKNNRNAPNYDDMVRALEKIGKDPSYMLKRVSEEDNNKNANECII